MGSDTFDDLDTFRDVRVIGSDFVAGEGSEVHGSGDFQSPPLRFNETAPVKARKCNLRPE